MDKRRTHVQNIVENLIKGTAKISNFMSSPQEDLEMATVE
jgi:hypothetical protein